MAAVGTNTMPVIDPIATIAANAPTYPGARSNWSVNGTTSASGSTISIEVPTNSASARMHTASDRHTRTPLRTPAHPIALRACRVPAAVVRSDRSSRADTTNVAAFAASAVVGPNAAITAPPTA